MSFKILRSLTSLNKPWVFLNLWKNGSYQQIYIVEECFWEKLEILIVFLSLAIPVFEIKWTWKSWHLKLPPFSLDFIGSSFRVNCQNSVMTELPDLHVLPHFFLICAKIILVLQQEIAKLAEKNWLRSTDMNQKYKAQTLHQMQSIC